MKIKFLGTAAAEGIPGLFCNCEVCRKALEKGNKNIMTRSQSLIDDKLLIELNGDTYQHFLNMGRTLYDIDDVLITHSHVDHFSFEQFDSRFYHIAYNLTQEKLNIYTSQDCIDQVNDYIKLKNINVDKFNDRFNLIPMEYYKEYDIKGYKVTPLPACHAKPEKAFIFLIEKEGKTLFYGNDTGIFDIEIDNYLKEHNKHIDLLELDCTKADTDGTYNSHMSMKEGKAIYDRFIKLGLIDDKTILYFNHFSHNGLMVYDELVEAAKKYGFNVTFDGLEVEF